MRAWLLLALLLSAGPAAAVDYAAVRADPPLRFPADHGSHPAFRTEWWYLTGVLRAPDGHEIGFQATFFRSRPGLQEDLPGTFAARQLLLAHAALADPREGRLRVAQRAARAGFGLAQADEGDLALRLGAWTLRRTGAGLHLAVPADTFTLELDAAPTAALLLQGPGGVSRKGPQAAQASRYVSWPGLQVRGRLLRDGVATDVSGQAWLDHEWSSTLLHPEAVGWDWTGLNLDDGAALMVFRIRRADGSVLWAGGTLRDARGRVRYLAPESVAITVRRRWRSPRSGVSYPVAVEVRAADLRLELEPLMDDQEVDARASTGNRYWEGAVRALAGGRRAGRGYLELTGYDGRLDL